LYLEVASTPGMQIKLTPNMADALQTCPFSFQEKFLTKAVREPAFRYNPASRMGQNVHAALDIFYRRGGCLNLSEMDLLDLLNQKWDSDGFSSIEEELAYKQEASRLLRNYHSNSIHEPTCQLRITETFHITARAVTLGQHKVVMSGRFDRLDLYGNGTLEVIDYKTGQAGAGFPDKEDFAGRLSNLIYFRLAKDLFPEVREITVSHYYLRSQRKISVCYTPQVIEAARSELEILLDELEVGVAPTLVNHNCAWCLVRKVGRCHQFSQVESETEEILF
jgi:hypothetical protein